MDKLRNFCIIAHIDHGKSTLADRLLEVTGTVDLKDMQAQLLDDMELERERGITIKSHAIQMCYHFQQQAYTLNLIDTPGHVDFSYEVSRAVASCEGALLVVDATQGIQAQTLSNLYLALEKKLTIVPILNKIDLASARPEEVSQEIIDLLDCKEAAILKVSAKEGRGIKVLLEAIIKRIPPPEGDPNAPLEAMIFDATYDPYRGVKVFFRIFNGTLKSKSKIRFLANQRTYIAEQIGTLDQQHQPTSELLAGDIGYLTANIKRASEIMIGDTLTTLTRPCNRAIAGFSQVKPMVFAALYPLSSSDYKGLRKALEKLQLSDASLTWQAESSVALGFGFRCGFLGMLHMEIVKERISREAKLEVILTIPSVEWRWLDKQKKWHHLQSPCQMPSAEKIESIQEPLVEAKIITKSNAIGPIVALSLEKRGRLLEQSYLHGERVVLRFILPLSEIIIDFYDQLKSLSRGYASLDYQPAGFAPAKLVKLDLLFNNQKVEALATIVHRDKAAMIGRKICEKAKEIIPSHLFEVRIQAAIGNKVVARVTIKAKRKDVTSGLYGGDVTRKRKLLEAQKKGKKKMRQIGKVNIPQNAFLNLLRLD